jgi:hypothetical protein
MAGWTIKGQPAYKYRSSTTRRPSGLSPIQERNLWKIVRQAIRLGKLKTAPKGSVRRGRFVVRVTKNNNH